MFCVLTYDLSLRILFMSNLRGIHLAFMHPIYWFHLLFMLLMKSDVDFISYLPFLHFIITADHNINWIPHIWTPFCIMTSPIFPTFPGIKYMCLIDYVLLKLAHYYTPNLSLNVFLKVFHITAKVELSQILNMLSPFLHICTICMHSLFTISVL